MSDYRTLLKNRNFVLYSVGQAFSQFGDRLVQIVLIGYIYKRWPGSTLQLAKLFLFTVLPSFFISPIAGVFIDRWNKKYVMVASDLIRAATILCIPIFFIYRESIIPIYMAILIIFTAACFFLPSRLSAIPSLVSKDNLLLANSASSITWVLSGIAGLSLGGFLAEWTGIRNSLYANSLVYFLSAVSFLALIFSMKSKHFSAERGPESVAVKKDLGKSFFHDLKEGLKTLLFDKKIRIVTYLFFVLASLTGSLYVVTVVYIQEELHSMTKDVGIFGMCLFLGLLGGSYVCGKMGKRLPREKTVFLSLTFTGFFIVVFAVGLKVTKSFWFGSASAVLMGLCLSPIYVTANTIIHESVDHNLRGRIFSSVGIIMNVGFLIFMYASSMLAEHIDKIWIIIACGVGFALCGLVSMWRGLLKELTFSS